MDPEKKTVTLRYQVPTTRPDWTLPEEPMPESLLHDQVLDLLKSVLRFWIARTGLDAHVARNLAVRWDPTQPRVGIDPDLCVLSPVPSEGEGLTSLCTWRAGHEPPLLAVEVVSENSPRKDYESAPMRYAASGTRELWIFDPLLVGPRSHGGPYRLQLWCRGEDGSFEQVYAGDGPVWSPAVQGWLHATSEGLRLRIADDEEGTAWWFTAEEAERAAKETARAEQEKERAAKEAARAAAQAERAAKEQERAAKERERAAKEAALARIAELEAELRRQGQ